MYFPALSIRVNSRWFESILVNSHSFKAEKHELISCIILVIYIIRMFENLHWVFSNTLRICLIFSYQLFSIIPYLLLKPGQKLHTVISQLKLSKSFVFLVKIAPARIIHI